MVSDLQFFHLSKLVISELKVNPDVHLNRMPFFFSQNLTAEETIKVLDQVYALFVLKWKIKEKFNFLYLHYQKRKREKRGLVPSA